MEERIIKDINNLLAQLFQKMKEAGYEWNDEKKELKKIEQSCYHNDGLYYAIDILEKTLGKVEGYQSDDGMIEHQTAIETVNTLYHKKPAVWGEEDEKMLTSIIDDTVQEVVLDSKQITWLKSIKPNHWKPSEEQLKELRALLDYNIGVYNYNKFMIVENLYNDLENL